MVEQSGIPRETIKSSRRPNVVVILADDMGWGDIGCNGATAIPTPHLNALAERGVNATDAHSSSAVCTPSRYALMTGRYAWRGPLKRGVLAGHGPALIEPKRPTLASVLKDNGYATGAFGKWHLGLGWVRKDGNVPTAFGPDAVEVGVQFEDDWDQIDYTKPFKGGPVELGFDRFFGISGSLDMPPYCFLSQDRTLGIPDREKEKYINQRPGLQTPGWQDDEVDTTFVAEATLWIRQQAAREDPFFVYLATAAPHRPCVPPKFVRGKSHAGVRGDSVVLVDWMVGEVVKALEDSNVLDDTLIIFTSDNGAPMIYLEDGDVTVHRPNGPWRGQKGDIWDGGHREPLLISWPARLPTGVRADALICLTDVLPTIGAALGIDLPEGAAEDGLDILAALDGGTSAAGDRAVVHHSLGGRFALRFGQWKVEFCTGSGGGFSSPAGDPFDKDHPVGQLYDLTVDPGETTDLWEQRPDIVRRAYARLVELSGGDASGFPSDVIAL